MALNYCDELTELVIKLDAPEQNKVPWLRSRDETTRADMAQLVNEGWPGGEALVKAKQQKAHYWRMADGTVASVCETAVPTRSPSRGRERSRDNRGRGKQGPKPRNQQQNGQKPPQQNVQKTISMDSNGIKYCGAFNTARGCPNNERKCAQRGRHACSVMLDKGKACGRKDHGATGH